MKLLLLPFAVLCALLLSRNLLAQDTPIKPKSFTDSTVSFIAYWQKGDVKKFHVTKSHLRKDNGKIIKNSSTEYDATCTVKDATENGYLLEWQFHNNVLKNVPIPAGARELANKYQLYKITYETNEVGTFQRIVNWKEVGEYTSELLHLLIRTDTTNAIKYEKALRPIIAAFSSKEGVESLLLAEIQLLHYPMGLEFSRRDTVKYEESLPNLVTGEDPLTGQGKFYLTDFDSTSDRIAIINEIAIDPASFKKFVTGTIKEISENQAGKNRRQQKKAAEKVDRGFANLNFTMSDIGRYDYRYYPGWPIKIVKTRHVEGNGDGSFTEQENTTTIEEIAK